MAELTISINNLSNTERSIYKGLRLGGLSRKDATYVLLGFYTEISENILLGKNIVDFLLDKSDDV